MSRFLPYGRQQIDDDDVSAVVAVLKSDWLTTGPAVGAFETALARAVDAPHAVACSSATAGLHLAALAAEIGPGDRAIVPTLTFLASANAIRYVGAEVIFADVDPDSGLMRPVDLEAAYRRAGGPVKAVIPVHYAGQAESPERIREIAAANGSIVIEDACHAIGASYASTQGPVSVGSCAHSEMAVFSFHPVKTVAMGEGGAVTTRDPRLAERLKRLSSHGMHKDAELFQNRELAFDTNGTPNLWYYEMPEPGFNYRASDIHCALGLSQLKKLHLFVDTRRKLVARYDLLLEPLGEFVRPLARVPGANPAWHLYVALIDFTKAGKTRMQIMRGLHQAGIGTQVHYLPVHLQPYYTALGNTPDLPGALAFYQRCLSLPLFASMTADDVDRVVWALRSVLESPMILREELRGDRLVLRTLEAGDVGERYLSWMLDADTQRFLESRFDEHDIPSLIDFVDRCNRSEAMLLLGIYETASGLHIGNIKLGPIDRRHCRAAIGIMLGESTCRGKGYGPEAIGLVAGYAFSALNLKKLTAGCYADNNASRAAFERSGFLVEAVLKSHLQFNGRFVDLVLLTKLNAGKI